MTSNLSDYHLYLYPPKVDRRHTAYCLRRDNQAYSFSEDLALTITTAISKLARRSGWPFTANDEATLIYLGTLDQFPELLL